MPHYRKHGKKQTIITDEEFADAMRTGDFVKVKHRGFVALIYYTGIRKAEALRCKPEQFRLADGFILFDVGKRLKKGKETPALNIPLEAPYVKEIEWCIQQTRKNKRIWTFSERTAWNIFDRVLDYPHHCRLSRITRFFAEGWSIAEVQNWTGLSLKALDSYLGIVSVKKMGESLGPKINVVP